MTSGTTRTLFAAIVAVGIVHALAYWYVTSDDAFISLRYARNLARGDGLLYNPGLPPVIYAGSSMITFLLSAALASALRARPFQPASSLVSVGRTRSVLAAYSLERAESSRAAASSSPIRSSA